MTTMKTAITAGIVTQLPFRAFPSHIPLDLATVQGVGWVFYYPLTAPFVSFPLSLPSPSLHLKYTLYVSSTPSISRSLSSTDPQVLPLNFLITFQPGSPTASPLTCPPLYLATLISQLTTPLTLLAPNSLPSLLHSASLNGPPLPPTVSVTHSTLFSLISVLFLTFPTHPSHSLTTISSPSTFHPLL